MKQITQIFSEDESPILSQNKYQGNKIWIL